MIRHETITVSGTVLYCDGCGKRGPESAYDNISDTMEQAEMMGWEIDDDKSLLADDRDLCEECAQKKDDAQKKDKKGKKKS